MKITQDLFPIQWTDQSNDSELHLDIVIDMAKRHHLSFVQLREAFNWVTCGGELYIELKNAEGYRIRYQINPSDEPFNWIEPKEFLREYRLRRFDPAIDLDDDEGLWRMIRQNSSIDILDGQQAYFRAEAYLFALVDCHLLDPDHAGYLLTRFREKYWTVGSKGLMGKEVKG